jgi:hypothetical protein
MTTKKKKPRIRPIQFPLFTNLAEREYIAREAFDIRTHEGNDLSQNDLVIKRTMRPGWRQRLEELRALQARHDQAEILGKQLLRKVRAASR